MKRWRVSPVVAWLMLVTLPSVADADPAGRGVVGAWTFAGLVPGQGQPVAVHGRFIVQRGGTMVLTDDGASGKALPPSTLAALAAQGVRIGQGPALGSWSLTNGVFTFRVTRFLYDSSDLLGASIATQTIGGTGVFRRGHGWEFANGWIVKWEGPDFDATTPVGSTEHPDWTRRRIRAAFRVPARRPEPSADG